MAGPADGWRRGSDHCLQPVSGIKQTNNDKWLKVKTETADGICIELTYVCKDEAGSGSPMKTGLR